MPTEKRKKRPAANPGPREIPLGEAAPMPPPEQGGYTVDPHRLARKYKTQLFEAAERCGLVEAAFEQSQEELQGVKQTLAEAQERISELEAQLAGSEDEDSPEAGE